MTDPERPAKQAAGRDTEQDAEEGAGRDAEPGTGQDAEQPTEPDTEQDVGQDTERDTEQATEQPAGPDTEQATEQPAGPDTEQDTERPAGRRVSGGDGARPTASERAALFSVLAGGWIAQAAYAVAELGVPDLLGDGPRTAADLAAACGADARALRRALRALAAAGLVDEPAPHTFALTRIGRLLRSDAPQSARPAAIMFGEEVHRAFGEISHTLRTGRPAFERVHGKPFYDYLAGHPGAAATFTAAMGSAAVPLALVRCDLRGIGGIVDVGGGDGALLARVLARRPGAHGTLVDLPDAVERARRRLADSPVADRVAYSPGSFFDAGVVPPGADVYTLSRVLHNWDDDAATAILRRVREAVPEHGRLFVFEHLERPAPPAPGDRANLVDLLMLVMLEGYDRSADEYRELLAGAGFAVRSIQPPPFDDGRSESVIEALPA